MGIINHIENRKAILKMAKRDRGFRQILIEGLQSKFAYVGMKKAAPGQFSENQFIGELKRHLQLQGRTIRISQRSLGRYGSVYVNFINLPEEITRKKEGGGAEIENNRMMFSIDGFEGSNPDALVEKVKIEQDVNSISRDYRLRAKTGSPVVVAKYLAEFINKVVREVGPKYTHTKMGAKKKKACSSYFNPSQLPYIGDTIIGFELLDDLERYETEIGGEIEVQFQSGRRLYASVVNDLSRKEFVSRMSK